MPSNKQLFCFPYAGGRASFFDEIEQDLRELDFVKLEYPGHGSRHREELCRSFDELADDMFERVKAARSGAEYALFGYSMGCITLVEVLRRILSDGDMTVPSHVFLAAHEPITKRVVPEDMDASLDDWVKDRTIRFRTVPEKLIHNGAFWRMYLPLLRADYSMIGAYRFEELELCTEIPATVFYSEEDTPFADMEKWKRFFVGSCSFQRFTGTHFFIQRSHREMADTIRRDMI